MRGCLYLKSIANFRDIFIPVIPVLVATGLFSGFINCINAFGVEMNPNVLTIATILMKTAFTFCLY